MEFDQTPSSRAVMQYIRAVNQGGWLARLLLGPVGCSGVKITHRNVGFERDDHYQRTVCKMATDAAGDSFSEKAVETFRACARVPAATRAHISPTSAVAGKWRWRSRGLRGR